MDKKLVIMGASGHGKVVADIARQNGYEEIVFLDDDEQKTECGGYPVIGRGCLVDRIPGDVIVAIGNAAARKRISETVDPARIATLIHPKAVIAPDVTIERGAVVMAGAVINSCATIGKGCIINTSASVDHDCVIEDYAHISVGAHIAGTARIGKNTWIGAGATVSNNISVTSDCMIGAGAVVVRNIEESGVYVGVPAKKIK